MGQGPPQKTSARKVLPPLARPGDLEAPDSAMEAFDRIAKLLTGRRTAKKGKIVSGSPETQVQAVIDFLSANGFITAEN